MANPEHLAILKQGLSSWHEWRSANLNVRPDLSGHKFYIFICRGANLSSVDFAAADLAAADLSRSNLQKALFYQADLRKACLRDTDLRGADFTCANLMWADLTGADLRGANLSYASLVETNLTNATLDNCLVYGTAAWDTILDGTQQADLVITPHKHPIITVDNLEVAQFIYLLLNNQRIRYVIDTITAKMVLILGRFSASRKVALDAIRNELRKRDYLPVLFDFEKPSSRDITETISTLAHMARFVIADITEAKSIPQELQCIVPNLPSVPVQPILLASADEYGMFEHFKQYPWVLDMYRYQDIDDLQRSLAEKVVRPAEAAAARVAARRSELEHEPAV